MSYYHSYNYRKSSVNENIKIYKEIQEYYKHKDGIGFQTELAEIHFKGNVPVIKQKPALEQFDLPLNAEMLVKTAKNEQKKRIEDIKSANSKKSFYIVLGILIVSLVLLMDSEGIISGLLYGIVLIPVAFFVWMIVYSMFRVPKEEPVPYEASLQKYNDALLAYNYWQTIYSVKYWDELDGHSFERKVAELYRKYGYDAYVSKEGGDGGIDIVLSKGGEKTAVQCKAHNKAVGPAVARDLYGTMISSGYKKGMIVSKNGFTKGVYDFVQNKDIKLMDLNEIIKMVNETK